MGQFHFLVPQQERLPPRAIETAHVSGRDRLPFITRITTGLDGELVVHRDEEESGTFNILWPLEDRGYLLLSTATLIERPEPYHLPLELARGTLNRLRNLLADWQGSGLVVPTATSTNMHESLRQFVQAVAHQNSPTDSADFAERSILASLNAIDAIGVAIVEHVMQSRQRMSQKVLPLFAGRLADSAAESSIGTAFLKAFNAAVVPLSWGRVEADEGRQNWAACDAEIQWCTSQGLRIGGGPLLELSRRALPDWIYLWEGDFDNLMMVAGDYVRAAVNRYRGKVHFWNAAGRIISGDALGLEEEQRVRLAVRAVEVIRSVDTQTPVIVSFDQPWAEYMARRESDLAPLQFAEALVRSDLGISGIGLEINIGTSPAATLPRDLLEFNSQLDRWTALGLPLLVSLAVPGGKTEFTPAVQQRWLETYLPILVARPAVQAVIWNQLLDQEADDFPQTGLVDPQGHAKPSFATLASLRKQFSA